MEANPEKTWRFGDCCVDTARRELRRNGEPVDVQPRVFDLLVFLLSHHDRAVDKDELQAAVWPGRFITDTALTRAVMKARKAVGDDANRQAIIKTVHGHGYRFVAELLPGDPAGPSLAPDAAAASVGVDVPPPNRRRRLPLAWPLAVVLLLVVAGASWLWLRPAPELDSGTRLAVLPLTDDSGDPELAWTRLGLMSYAGELLGQDGSLPIVPEGSVIGLVDHFPWSGRLEDPENAELVDRLRQVYGASHLLAMRLEPDGNALRMNFELLGPDGSLQRGTVVGDEGTDLTEGVAQSVYGTLFGKRRRSGDTPLVSADPFNNEAYARGMDLSLQGRCAESLPFFRIIMEQEPGLFAPRYEYAACQRILGEVDEAEALLKQLVSEQRPLGATRPLAQALMKLGILYNRSGRLDPAEAAHREALDIARQLGDPGLEAEVLHNLSIVYEDRGDFDRAEEFLDRAQLAYQAAGREVMPGQLWSGKANLKMDRGRLAEAETYLEKALQAFREIGDQRNEAMMLNNKGYLLRSMGRLAEAEDYHLRSLALRQQIGDRVGTGRVYGMLSIVYAAQGRFDDALEAAAAARDIAQETRDRLFEATALAHLADAEKGRGDAEAARGYLREARVVFEDIDDSMRVLQVDLRLARLDLDAGLAGAAERVALEVLESARAAEQVQPEVEALELLGDIAHADGENAAAEQEWLEALDRVRSAGWGGKENELLVKLADLKLDLADLEAAAPLIGALSGQEANPRSLGVQARYAWARGERERAIDLMEAARKQAGEAWTPENEALLAGYRGD